MKYIKFFLSFEEQPGEVSLFSLKGSRLRGDLITLCDSLKGSCSPIEAGLSCCAAVRGMEEMALN